MTECWSSWSRVRMSRLEAGSITPVVTARLIAWPDGTQWRQLLGYGNSGCTSGFWIHRHCVTADSHHVTCFSDYRRGLDWWIDVLQPYTINSYLQAIQRYRWFTQFTVHRFLILLFLVGWDWVHLVLRPLLAYCTSHRWYMMVIIEQLVERILAGETEVLGENLPQRHSVHHRSHMTWPGLEPGPPWLEASG
jgi:hypothetical protein